MLLSLNQLAHSKFYPPNMYSTCVTICQIPEQSISKNQAIIKNDENNQVLKMECECKFHWAWLHNSHWYCSLSIISPVSWSRSLWFSRVFYSPSGIASLLANFPDFQQGNIKIATFGPTTYKAAKELKLDVNIKVPSPEFPSMTMALDTFISNDNRKAAK